MYDFLYEIILVFIFRQWWYRIKKWEWGNWGSDTYSVIHSVTRERHSKYLYSGRMRFKVIPVHGIDLGAKSVVDILLTGIWFFFPFFPLFIKQISALYRFGEGSLEWILIKHSLLQNLYVFSGRIVELFGRVKLISTRDTRRCWIITKKMERIRIWDFNYRNDTKRDFWTCMFSRVQIVSRILKL